MLTDAERQRRARNLLASHLQHPYDGWSLIRRFWIFQNERAQLLPLAVLAVALTVAVSRLNGNLHWPAAAVSSILVVLYLLQIRLADESKDFEHDSIHYPDRPVQRGLITLAELETLKNLVIILFVAVSASTVTWSVILWAGILQGYSFLTRREFYIREWLRRHFLIYQMIHYIQLLILCWLVLDVLQVSPLFERGVYFAFVTLMIGMLESSRTIGGRDQEAASDRYSHHLGVTRAVGIFFTFVLSSVSVGVVLLLRQDRPILWPLLAGGFLVVGAATVRYFRRPVTQRAEVLHIVALLKYLCIAGALIFA